MARALEAIDRKGRVRTAGGVHQVHEPDPVAVVDPTNIGPAVTVIRNRILRARRAGAGSYLFIDDEMRAYVVPELNSIAQLWIVERFRSLVGFYFPRSRSGEFRNTPFLTVAGIADDVAEHLRGATP